MRAFLIIFFFIIHAALLHAQDPHYSQFYANPLYLNPAFAGTGDDYRAILNHRQQWSKPVSFVTTSFSMDGNFNKGNSGWGVQILQDNQSNGTLKQTFVNGAMAHRVEIAKNKYIGMGLKFGIYQKRLDWSDLTFEDQLDERYGIVNPTTERFGKDRVVNGDVSAGFVYYSKYIFAGISANHLNRPSENFTIDSNVKLPIKYTLHFGSILPIYQPGKNYFISPNIIYEKQREFNYLNIGMYFGNDVFSVGGWYRINDAVIGLIGFNFDQFKFGYSYDVTVSQVSSNKSNTHEISIAYQFSFPKSYNKGRYKGKCPKFYKDLI